jgi:acetyl-CoA carboxylase carboxyltransferase component
MKTYQVQVHYQTTGYFEVVAESEDEAESMAIELAYAELPDELYAEIVHIEETEEEEDEEEEEE